MVAPLNASIGIVMTESLVLVRYGGVPEVARFTHRSDFGVSRGMRVVVATSRGQELGTVLETLRPSCEPGAQELTPTGDVLRAATDADLARQRTQRAEAEQEYKAWETRIAGWNLDLQLIDLEWTLDRSKLILYVLNDRGPECAKLALQAAAAGLGVIEVQPVAVEGLVPRESSGGGCGSCGCHN
jgi:cell fate regulator YaaT (PSP1 superfamily)